MEKTSRILISLCLSTAFSTTACADLKKLPKLRPGSNTTGDKPSGGNTSQDTPSGTGCEGHDPTPGGDISDYPLADGATIRGSVVGKPILCELESAYIRIERPAGARRLGTARSDQGGFDEGCMELPADAQDVSQCAVINSLAILRIAFNRLHAQGLKPNGVGVGPCGNLKGTYDGTNMSVGVTHWRNADDAVNIVAGLLEEYDLQGVVGVAVRGVGCMEEKPKGKKPEAEPEPICQATTFGGMALSKSKSFPPWKNSSRIPP